jgi:BMFP domain-containing protein YqiC
MQTQNPFLDEMARLTNAAMGLAQSAGEEARAAFRSQADRWVALKAELAALREEVAALRAAAPAKPARKPASK